MSSTCRKNPVYEEVMPKPPLSGVQPGEYSFPLAPFNSIQGSHTETSTCLDQNLREYHTIAPIRNDPVRMLSNLRPNKITIAIQCCISIAPPLSPPSSLPLPSTLSYNACRIFLYNKVTASHGQADSEQLAAAHVYAILENRAMIAESDSD